MSDHYFPDKNVVLVPNTLATITWGAVDIGQRFPESIIKADTVSIRFSCTTTSNNAVNCGVRYSTLTKDYLVSERKTLFTIPANGSVEVTPASKPSLGNLFGGIVSISLDLTSASAGSTTVKLIVDDDPPPLSSDPGAFIGLDAVQADDYLLITAGVQGTMASGANPFGTLYTVPAGKRFELLSIAQELGPSASYPGDANNSVLINLPGGGPTYRFWSKQDEYITNTIFGFPITLNSGGSVSYNALNNSASGVWYAIGIVGKEIF